jgi:hypothetical protein
MGIVFGGMGGMATAMGYDVARARMHVVATPVEGGGVVGVGGRF